MRHTERGTASPPAPSACAQSSLTLAWHPPLHDGGQPIVAYQVELQPLPGSAYLGAPLPPPALPKQQQQQQGQAAATGPAQEQGQTVLVYYGPNPVARVDCLQPGSAYQFHVTALNAQVGRLRAAGHVSDA